MAKRTSPHLVKFTCTGPCGKPTEAPLGSILLVFVLCKSCQDKRFADGMKLKLAAEAAEPKGGARAA